MRPDFVENVTSSRDPGFPAGAAPAADNLFKLLIKKGLYRLHRNVFKVRQIAVTPHFPFTPT